MNWTAEIISHNDDGLTMDVRYTRAGYAPVTVGVLLPVEGADLEDHLESYAPVGTWGWEDEKKQKRVKPKIGTKVKARQRQQPEAPAEPVAEAAPKVFVL